MFRVIKIVTLLTFVSARARAQKFDSQNFTSEWVVAIENSSFSPTVTIYKDYLIFVSFPQDSSIKLETSKFVNKPCEISTRFDAENTVEDNSFSPLYVETLGNDKVVIVYSESKKVQNLSNVWFYVIDPNKCSYDLGKVILDAPMELVTNFMSIVPYNDSFDVFVRSDKYCDYGEICRLRFNDKPAMIPGPSKSSIPFVHQNWDIISAKDYDSNEGYIYVLTATELNATIIRLLDPEFNLKTQTQVNQSGLASYWFTEDLSSSACFYISRHKLRCIFLDSSIKVKLVKTLNYHKYVQNYSTIRLANSEALIFTILSDKPNGHNAAVYVQRLNVDTESVTDPIVFQEFICDNSKMSTLRLLDDLFCNYVVCRDMINTKCVGPAEHRDF